MHKCIASAFEARDNDNVAVISIIYILFEDVCLLIILNISPTDGTSIDANLLYELPFECGLISVEDGEKSAGKTRITLFKCIQSYVYNANIMSHVHTGAQ